MAAPTITSVGTDNNTAAGTTIATGATVTAAVANNDWLVVFATAAPRSGDLTPISSCADSAGNVYTLRANVGFGDGSAGDGASLAIFTAPVTSNITSGTVTVTTALCNEKTLQVFRVRPAAGTISFVAADGTGVGGNLTSHAAATVSVSNGNTIFGAAGLETNDAVTGDTDTLNGSWSAVATEVANGASDSVSMTGVVQYKTVTATGNQSWACSTTSARQGICSYLVIKAQTAVALSLSAALGQYTLSGTAATMRLGIPPLVADPGSYALTGTAATPTHGWLVTADPGSYALTGTDAGTLHGWVTRVLSIGGYALFGTDASPFKTPVAGQALPAETGSYVLTGQDASLLHGWLLAASAGSYALSGTVASTLQGWKLDATVAGSYLLIGSDAALNATTGNKTIVADPGTYLLIGTAASTLVGFRVAADPGSYALTGTPATLTASVPATPPIRAIGEPPIARDKRRRREAERARALEQQRKARDRLKRAIGRLLEGLPPEFDTPEELDQAEGNAVQALNLMRAIQTPWREQKAVLELIDHIRAIRIAQPIVQLELAKAYNQAHRHLQQKAQEDVAMTLLLGE